MGDALYGGAEAPTQRELHPKKQRAGLNFPLFTASPSIWPKCSLFRATQMPLSSVSLLSICGS
jgi:hypothetical protein